MGYTEGKTQSCGIAGKSPTGLEYHLSASLQVTEYFEGGEGRVTIDEKKERLSPMEHNLENAPWIKHIAAEF